ncbi:MAG TPA: alpha/beta fold hydrolase [Chthoniobacterales bacterium]|nr:alpha/beta fold hydrolase [Chthoniobacterales bacterium]
MTDLSSWFFPVLIGGALLAAVLIFQRRFIYFPLRYSADQLQEAESVGTQEIRFQTTQGNQTAFFWRSEDSEVGRSIPDRRDAPISPAAAPKNLWLVFGGNGDLALAWLDLVCAFPSPGTGFLLVDYPGYGICQGKPNPRTIFENAEGALETLLMQKAWTAEPDALCVLGHSLGGAAALQFAAAHSVRKIIVISTFTSMDEMVRNQIGTTLGPLLRHRFDNRTVLQTILSQNPVPEISILHGTLDKIVPVRMGAALAQFDPTRIKFAAIPEAGHNDIIQKALPLILQTMGLQR